MTTPTWTEAHCPPAFMSLPDDIRGLALDFANAELEAGRHPDRALSFGIAKAFAIDTDDLGADATGFYIQAEDDRWVIFSDASDDRYTFDNYEDALRRGSELARARKLSLVVMTSDGGVIEKYELSGDDGAPALHLQPGSEGWILRGGEGGREVYPTKKEGLVNARERAKELGIDLVVHYRDGSVQARKAYA
ncbi:MAG: DUF2188 domain-containing protein [Myxococcota bacterium]